jgi:replicative DNA helicase
MTDITELEKIPPQNLEAEMSLLGSILLDKDAMLKIADIVDADDFYKNAHVSIFEIMAELYNKNEPVDVLTLGNRLEEKGNLEKIGGQSYLIKLSNTVPTSSHIEEYAKIVRRKSTLRKLLKASHEITRLGYQEDADSVEGLLDEAQQHLYGVTQKHLKQTFSPIREVLSGAFERIDDLHKEKGKLRGVPTGFKQLDNLLAGLQKSDLVILAARPSVGKTSLALDMARHVAVREKVPVGIFSLEMSKEQLVDRMLCAEANVDLWKMRTGNLSDRSDSQDFPRIGHAMGVLSEAPIYIDDQPGNNVMQIRTKARRLQAEHGLGLIVIDYLQLLESHSNKHGDNRVQEVAEMSRNLKGIARELNVPVLALSQLSRGVESRKPAIPKLSDLRDSGSIEQDADVVMFIYRKSADRNYREEDIPPDEKYITELHIDKHRNGPTGMVKLFFNAENASFRSLDSQFGDTTPTPATVQPHRPTNNPTGAVTPQNNSTTRPKEPEVPKF